jgi:hypothetical protein
MSQPGFWPEVSRSPRFLHQLLVATPNTDDVMQKLAGKLYGRYVKAVK